MTNTSKRVTIADAAIAAVMLSAVGLGGYLSGAHHAVDYSAPATEVQTDTVSTPALPELPPCATEDSENCYWDAANHGDGQGTSFVRWNGVTYYPEY